MNNDQMQEKLKQYIPPDDFSCRKKACKLEITASSLLDLIEDKDLNISQQTLEKLSEEFRLDLYRHPERVHALLKKTRCDGVTDISLIDLSTLKPSFREELYCYADSVSKLFNAKVVFLNELQNLKPGSRKKLYDHADAAVSLFKKLPMSIGNLDSTDFREELCRNVGAISSLVENIGLFDLLDLERDFPEDVREELYANAGSISSLVKHLDRSLFDFLYFLHVRGNVPKDFRKELYSYAQYADQLAKLVKEAGLSLCKLRLVDKVLHGDNYKAALSVMAAVISCKRLRSQDSHFRSKPYRTHCYLAQFLVEIGADKYEDIKENSHGYDEIYAEICNHNELSDFVKNSLVSFNKFQKTDTRFYSELCEMAYRVTELFIEDGISLDVLSGLDIEFRAELYSQRVDTAFRPSEYQAEIYAAAVKLRMNNRISLDVFNRLHRDVRSELYCNVDLIVPFVVEASLSFGIIRDLYPNNHELTLSVMAAVISCKRLYRRNSLRTDPYNLPTLEPYEIYCGIARFIVDSGIMLAEQDSDLHSNRYDNNNEIANLVTTILSLFNKFQELDADFYSELCTKAYRVTELFVENGISLDILRQIEPEFRRELYKSSGTVFRCLKLGISLEVLLSLNQDFRSELSNKYEEVDRLLSAGISFEVLCHSSDTFRQQLYANSYPIAQLFQHPYYNYFIQRGLLEQRFFLEVLLTNGPQNCFQSIRNEVVSRLREVWLLPPECDIDAPDMDALIDVVKGLLEIRKNAVVLNSKYTKTQETLSSVLAILRKDILRWTGSDRTEHIQFARYIDEQTLEGRHTESDLACYIDEQALIPIPIPEDFDSDESLENF